MPSLCLSQRALLAQTAEGRPPGTDLRLRRRLGESASRHLAPKGGTDEISGLELPWIRIQLPRLSSHWKLHRNAATMKPGYRFEKGSWPDAPRNLGSRRPLRSFVPSR